MKYNHTSPTCISRWLCMKLNLTPHYNYLLEMQALFSLQDCVFVCAKIFFSILLC